MRRLALACCLLAGAALAAPVPKSKPDFGGGWDRPVGTDHGCKFTFGSDSLMIEAPGGRPSRSCRRSRGGT